MLKGSIENFQLYRYETHWHCAELRFGNFVAFNGSDLFCTLVTNILRHPDAYLKILDCESNLTFEYLTLRESFRPSSNNQKYDWYIKYSAQENIDRLRKIHTYVFDHALIYAHFLKENSLLHKDLLQHIPEIKNNFEFFINDPVRRIVSITTKSIVEPDPESDKIASKVVNLLMQNNLLKTGLDDQTTKQINELELTIDELREKITSNQEIIASHQAEVLKKDQEISNLYQSLESQNRAAFTIFKSIFPNLNILNESAFFSEFLKTKYLHLHIKALLETLDNINKKEGNNVLNEQNKVANLESWFKIEVFSEDIKMGGTGIYDHQWQGGIKREPKKLSSAFYISISEKYGNKRYFVHFSDFYDEACKNLLEKNDPPMFDHER